MKIAYLTLWLSVPPDNGVGVREYNLLNRLAERHRLNVLAFERVEQGMLKEWADEKFDSLTLLPSPPSPRLSLSATRTFFKRLFSYPPETFMRYQKSLLVEMLGNMLEQPSPPEVIVCNTLMLASAISNIACTVPRVVVLYDISQILAYRHMLKTELGPYKLMYFVEWLKTRHWENRFLRSHDHFVVMSEIDKRFITRINPNAHVIVVPNGVDTQFFSFSDSIQTTSQILLVGNFAYGPNEDAFWHFYKEIFPRICEQCPQASLIVLGRDPTKEMCIQAQRDERLIVTGMVPDLRPYYAQAAVSVVPIRAGGGTRLKILEAFSVGVPVVSTRIGAEGIECQDGKELLLADSPDEFADKTIQLLQNQPLRSMLARNARDLVVTRYDWSKIVLEMERVLVESTERKL